ncbi:keratin, type I cytoskeletal 9-like [Lingula anatina]|uniref:receptor protein-tyrosine kinase n=1 Tax=Lingula anatina TaxID=7574 RepID=A0A1S3KG73_LINAN|nr:keratin, type I cytoskeletal 9-like [Lingula anatina]|eukprot:XP_013421640.1 keratin, type I cytoskeletal 9-like [Lingula anatina]
MKSRKNKVKHEDIDECAIQPCKNGATCYDGVNSYICMCPPGYTGQTCDTDIDECTSQPCKNGFTCKDGVNSYSCVCPPGYTGQTCDLDIDECASLPCTNGATCKDGVNSYSCVCPPGYTGQTCDIVPVFKANFTTLGAEGRLGPTSVGSHYDGQSHEGLVNVTQGIQNFSVPYPGTYRIEAAGAAGGCDTYYSPQGCDLRLKGAYVAGSFQLSAGETLHILVGQKGGYNSYGAGSGGGGGSFVANSTNSPLIVAGGGGGTSHIRRYHPECDGTTNPEGGTAYGTSWTGGRDGNGAPGYRAGCGGGGFYTDGGNSSNYDCTGGKSFLHGGEGGLGVHYRSGSDGGFGGGGGSKGSSAAGGGGGYSGGAGGIHGADYCGGGGGSFNSGINATGINGYNIGHGFVIIEYYGY